MHSNNTWCVIMAGGTGTRFWPISTTDVPKQFLPVGETGQTFIQMTASRFQGIIPPERILVVTSRKYVGKVEENLPDIPRENIIVEPYNRDTAPCVALAMYTILKRDPDALMIIVPSDHLILDKDKFQKIIRFAMEDLPKYDALSTIGITPTGPNTNYGYIQTDGIPEEDCPIKVRTFTEKPDKQLAEIFVSSGDFLWNSGIFLWKASTIQKEFERLMPQLVSQFSGWQTALGTPDEPAFLDKVYSDLQKISIDYAIMERTDKAWVYPAGIGWFDIGTWDSLYDYYPDKDADGNAFNTQHFVKDSGNNLVISTNNGKLVALCGLDGFTIVDTEKVLLVCPKDDKKFREFMSNLALPEFKEFR